MKKCTFFHFFAYFVSAATLNLFRFPKKNRRPILTITSWYPAFFYLFSKISREWNTQRNSFELLGFWTKSWILNSAIGHKTSAVIYYLINMYVPPHRTEKCFFNLKLSNIIFLQVGWRFLLSGITKEERESQSSSRRSDALFTDGTQDREWGRWRPGFRILVAWLRCKLLIQSESAWAIWPLSPLPPQRWIPIRRCWESDMHDWRRRNYETGPLCSVNTAPDVDLLFPRSPA
jgi:hypothetical protein